MLPPRLRLRAKRGGLNEYPPLGDNFIQSQCLDVTIENGSKRGHACDLRFWGTVRYPRLKKFPSSD